MQNGLRTVRLPEAPARGDDTAGTFRRAMRVLEIVAASQGASAREVAAISEIPLPSVYRMLRLLVDSGFLVHLSAEHRYELGFKVHHLAASLHRQLAVPRAVSAQVRRLHEELGAAGYWTVYRGAELVVAYVADSPAAPRVQGLGLGGHEGAHATAFGKIMLAGMTAEHRDAYLREHPMAALTPATTTGRQQLEDHLHTVTRTGVAWEFEEFRPGLVCAATAVCSRAGEVMGSVAVSGTTELASRPAQVEAALRAAADAVGRYLRGRPARGQDGPPRGATARTTGR